MLEGNDDYGGRTNNKMNTLRKFLPLALIAAWPAVQPALAQSCTGLSDFSGHYMFVASRSAYSTAAPAPERVTNIPQKYSPAPVGILLRGALDTAPFAGVGRILADGQGGLYAGPAEAVYITTRVGSYSVSQECTLSMTLTDGFLPIDLIAPPTPAAVRFTGVLQSRGGESTLSQISGGEGTMLALSRAHQANSCSNATFTGPYGLAAQGVRLAETEPEAKTPNLDLSSFSMVGRIISDGAGSLFLQDGTQGTALQLTGTYTLLADCSGTAKITDGKTTRTINFVLTQANSAQNFTASGVGFSRPVMHFVIADPRLAVTGVGREATGRL